MDKETCEKVLDILSDIIFDASFAMEVDGECNPAYIFNKAIEAETIIKEALKNV